MYKIICDDSKIKLLDVVDTLKILKERVGYIVREYLGMLCEKRVPCELTIE